MQSVNWEVGKEGAAETGVKRGPKSRIDGELEAKKAHKPWISEGFRTAKCKPWIRHFRPPKFLCFSAKSVHFIVYAPLRGVTLNWEVLNGVGVDGVGGIFPCVFVLRNSLFFFVFHWFFILSFFFAFLLILIGQEQTTAMHWNNGEFDSDPVCTDPIQNFPIKRIACDLSCARLRVPPVALHVSRYTCRSWFPGFCSVLQV